MANPWADEQPNECDARFPSGRWTGYWAQEGQQGRMSLHITFAAGRLFGDGRDLVGDFMLSGRYDLQTGRCFMHKTYLGQHEVVYEGQAGPAGIRGGWAIHDQQDGSLQTSGPFHIWPLGHGLQQELRTEVAEPVAV